MAHWTFFRRLSERRKLQPMRKRSTRPNPNRAVKADPSKQRTVVTRNGDTHAARAMPDEIEVRLRFVEKLLVGGGFTKSQVIEACHEQYGLSGAQSEQLYVRVQQSIKEQHELDERYQKAMQIARVRGVLTTLQSQFTDLSTPKRDDDGKLIGKVDLRELRAMAKEISNYETLLARLEGNFAPLEIKAKVEHNVKQAYVAVVAGMTEDDINELTNEQMELERKANALLTEGVQAAE